MVGSEKVRVIENGKRAGFVSMKRAKHLVKAGNARWFVLGRSIKLIPGKTRRPRDYRPDDNHPVRAAVWRGGLCNGK